MTNIFSIFNFNAPAVDGWAENDLQSLLRTVHILRHNGVALSYDYGMSDEGDPWFGYYDAYNGDQLFHIARINNRYIACRMLFAQHAFEALTLNRLIAQLADELPMTTIKTKSSNPRNRLFMHPASLLGALVATAVLLTKSKSADALENSLAASCKLPHFPDSVVSRHPRIKSNFDQTQPDPTIAYFSRPALVAGAIGLVLGKSTSDALTLDGNITTLSVDHSLQDSNIKTQATQSDDFLQVVANILRAEHPDLDSAGLSKFADANISQESQLPQSHSSYEIAALHAAIQLAKTLSTQVLVVRDIDNSIVISNNNAPSVDFSTINANFVLSSAFAQNSNVINTTAVVLANDEVLDDTAQGVVQIDIPAKDSGDTNSSNVLLAQILAQNADAEQSQDDQLPDNNQSNSDQDLAIHETATTSLVVLLETVADDSQQAAKVISEFI